MTLARLCCCSDYVYFRPCYFTTGQVLRMPATDFETCGFDQSKVYKYTGGSNNFCGHWGDFSSSYDVEVTTCTDFSTAFDDCCDCITDIFPNDCCGFDECMKYKYDNSLSPGFQITGYSGGGALVVSSNAGVDQYQWRVDGISAGNYSIVSVGSGKYEIEVDLTISFSVYNYLDSGTTTCDGSRLPKNSWAWSWSETKTYRLGCGWTFTRTDEGGDCRGDLICDGDVEVGQTLIGAVCDRWQSGAGTATSTTVNYTPGTDCTQTGTFSATIPVDVRPDRFPPASTNPCCSGFDATGTLDQIWINAQTTREQDITLTGSFV